jgi:hypothetical protein
MNCTTTTKMRFNVFTASTPLHDHNPTPSEVGVGVGGDNGRAIVNYMHKFRDDKRKEYACA